MTSLETIIRGLMPPNFKSEVEVHAVDQAKTLCAGLQF